MIGDLDVSSDNLNNFLFTIALGYTWFFFLLKRLWMNGWN